MNTFKGLLTTCSPATVQVPGTFRTNRCQPSSKEKELGSDRNQLLPNFVHIVLYLSEDWEGSCPEGGEPALGAESGSVLGCGVAGYQC